MLLSGIVITIAFILTALTLSQVASLERQAAADKPSGIAEEWRFLHERLASNLETAITPDVRRDTFQDTTWPAIVATFRAIEAERGYDAVVRLAGPAVGAHNEYADLTREKASSPPDREYAGNWSVEGEYRYVKDYDLVNDGLIEENPCPDATVAGSCIVGVYVFLSLSDGRDRMEEYILFPVNVGG